MELSQRVIILGSSLLLSVVADHLEQSTPLEVIRIPLCLPDTLERIGEKRPHVVIMEYPQRDDAGSAVIALSLLRHYPGLKLIGLDSTQSELVVLSSSGIMVNQVADLLPFLA